MQSQQSKQTAITKSNGILASGTGNAPFQKVNLSDIQKDAIADFYSLNDAEEYKGQLMEMLSIYVASSCPHFGELSEDDINRKSALVRQITNLLFVIEPLRTELKGGE